MTQAPSRPTQLLTFEEFLKWDADDAAIYELVAGVITPMAEPSGKHESVRSNLAFKFEFEKRRLKLELEIQPKTLLKLGKRDGRRPDLIVIERDRWEKATQIEAVLYEAPQLVIEIVSTNWEDDYQNKPLWYAALGAGVPEYWIVDSLEVTNRYPKRKNPEIEVPTISVLTLGPERQYRTQRFTGDDRIESLLFPELQLTVNQVMAAR